MRRRRRYSVAGGSVEGFEAQARHWALQLIAYGMTRPRRSTTIPATDTVCQLLGVDAETAEEMGRRDFRRKVREALSNPSGTARRSGPLTRNVARLAKLLELTPAEQEVLTFTIVLQSDELLRACAEEVGELNAGEVERVLAAVLGLERRDVEDALHREATLRAAGLVEVDLRGPYSLPNTLELLKGAGSALLTEQRDVHALFVTHFRRSPRPEVRLDQYPHLREEVDFLRNLLQRVLRIQASGINLLFHGPAGTGKTQLVRALAQTLRASLYEVASGDEEGDGIEGKDRFRAYRLCQRVLSRHRRHLILFDEVEDVFPEPAFWLGRSSQVRTKAWVNQLLEENPVPTLWLSNHVEQIDPAYLRRFDYVLEVPVPPKQVRRQMLDSKLADVHLKEETLERLAGNEHLTPADIARARKVIGLLGAQAPVQAEAALERALRGHFEVRGFPFSLKANKLSTLPYDVGYCNASMDLRSLALGLERHHQGRICLYGPPGTGKTAFGHHLAERLDCPLIERRASDLLDKYVGETEKRIAQMFRQAASEGAILLLDEADSFLRSREGAVRSWEVTQVNELLKQMEAFEGVFVCATNLMDDLDQAVLRRFDLKVQYRYLTPGQAEGLFVATLRSRGVDVASSPAILSRLAGLDNLTPGDFATVVRQARLSGEALIPRTLLGRLEAECRLKNSRASRPIGFTASL